jgi:hypothetical protein
MEVPVINIFKKVKSRKKIFQKTGNSYHLAHLEAVDLEDLVGAVPDAGELAGLAERQPCLHHLQRIDHRLGEGARKAPRQEPLVDQQVAVFVTLTEEK